MIGVTSPLHQLLGEFLFLKFSYCAKKTDRVRLRLEGNRNREIIRKANWKVAKGKRAGTVKFGARILVGLHGASGFSGGLVVPVGGGLAKIYPRIDAGWSWCHATIFPTLENAAFVICSGIRELGI